MAEEDVEEAAEAVEVKNEIEEQFELRSLDSFEACQKAIVIDLSLIHI